MRVPTFVPSENEKKKSPAIIMFHVRVCIPYFSLLHFLVRAESMYFGLGCAIWEVQPIRRVFDRASAIARTRAPQPQAETHESSAW